ncbi:hypothetical protein, partial [Siminovitchia fortis]|uniref:hypothetical protein n=1 Tax=Siminovitchia fortis TaxID=254758 RepID=UPI0036F3A628
MIIPIPIPYSLILTFLLIFFPHFPFNIITLPPLALPIPILLHNPILLIQNIYTHLSIPKHPNTPPTQPPKQLPRAITPSTLTTVPLFLPL